MIQMNGLLSSSVEANMHLNQVCWSQETSTTFRTGFPEDRVKNRWSRQTLSWLSSLVSLTPSLSWHEGTVFSFSSSCSAQLQSEDYSHPAPAATRRRHSKLGISTSRKTIKRQTIIIITIIRDCLLFYVLVNVWTTVNTFRRCKFEC